jgi:hypothetical protein
MERAQVHYEVFARRTPQSPWKLEFATEDRAHALQSAEELLAEERAAAVRVTKETLDTGTMEFQSVTLLTKGASGPERRKFVREAAAEPPCLSPGDLYSSTAREKIGRLLEDWLRRWRVTPFELLHRPDLAEKLEASGNDLQHAIQKVAIPESQATGQPVHELIRSYQRLAEQAIERVIRAGRKSEFPDLDQRSIGEVAMTLVGHPDRLFLLGGAVSAVIAEATTWRDKVDRLLDLAGAAPTEPNANALCQVVLEQPLAEILCSKQGLADLLGADLDLGGALAALTRLAAAREVEGMAALEPAVGKVIPPLQGPAARLGVHLAAGSFKLLGVAIARRVLAELNGPRRLRPSDAAGEIEVLRALAMALTASAGRLLSHDEVQAVFVERSKAIVAADFVDAYLGKDRPALEEAKALVRLCENVAGGANKRQAARWLMGCVAALKFETELRSGEGTPAGRLAALAALQKSVRRVELSERDVHEISAKIGEIGGLVEADSRLVAQLVKAPASTAQKLTLLLKLAAGDAAPQGPAADRARAEAMRLLKAPEARAEVAGSPELASRVREVLAA